MYNLNTQNSPHPPCTSQGRIQGGAPSPLLTPPLNQKFSATPKIYSKLSSSSKIVDFTTFFLKFLSTREETNKQDQESDLIDILLLNGLEKIKLVYQNVWTDHGM